MTSRSSQSGFTLLEMIVVIAIMALILGLVSEYGPQKDRWVQTRGAAQAVAEAMTNARARAISTGAAVVLALPPVPAWLHENAAPITFEPDGSSTGGTVTLAEQGRSIDITADWLTARVTLHEQ